MCANGHAGHFGHSNRRRVDKALRGQDCVPWLLRHGDPCCRKVRRKALSEPFRPPEINVVNSQNLDTFFEKRVGHGSSRAARAELQDTAVGNASQVTPKRFRKSIAVGIVTDALAFAKDDGVHGSKGFCIFRKLIEQGEDVLFAREGDVQSCKSHALGRDEEFRKCVGRQMQFIDVNELIEAVQPLDRTLPLMHGRGKGGLNPGADQAEENPVARW